MNGGVADSARRMHSMNRRSCSADRSATAWLAGQQRRVAVGRAARPRWLLLPQTEGERDGETDRQTHTAAAFLRAQRVSDEADISRPLANSF